MMETRTHTNADGSTVQVGVDAVVSPRAHIGPDAVVRGGRIWGGKIYGGKILGGSIWAGSIWAGTIRGGEIHGGTIRGGEVHGGVICGGMILGGVIHGGEIWGGEILGGAIRGGMIRGGRVFGGSIWGGTIWGGAINAGTIRAGLVESTEDVVVGSDGPSLLTAVPNKDRTGWLIVSGSSRAVPFDLGCDDDPFVDWDLPETQRAAAERSAALVFMRTICRSRQTQWSNKQWKLIPRSR